MMLPFLLIVLLSTVAQLVLPWWIIAVIAFGVCFWYSRTGLSAFANGFAGIAIVWFTYALVIHWQTDGILTGRMADLFFKTPTPALLLILTPVVGGLVGGFAGLAGQQLRAVFQSKP